MILWKLLGRSFKTLMMLIAINFQIWIGRLDVQLIVAASCVFVMTSPKRSKKVKTFCAEFEGLQLAHSAYAEFVR